MGYECNKIVFCDASHGLPVEKLAHGQPDSRAEVIEAETANPYQKS